MFKAVMDVLGGGLLKGANKLAKTFIGSKQDRDRAGHTEHIAFLKMVASENKPLVYRTKWDSFVDGINRLVRPIFTFGTIYLFYFCMKYPTDFAISMKALTLMPTQGWYLLFTIVVFWFGGKFIRKDLKAPKSINSKDLTEVMEAKQAYTEKKQRLDKRAKAKARRKITEERVVSLV